MSDAPSGPWTVLKLVNWTKEHLAQAGLGDPRLAAEILGDGCHGKYVEVKQVSADRCPKELGMNVKRGEIMFHHEVTNQFLWNQF